MAEKKKALVRVAFNRMKKDGLNYKGWDLLFAPGLQACNRSGDWLLVHEPTGLLIGGVYKTLTEAVGVAKQLAPLGDWTREDIGTDVEVFEKVMDLLNARLAAIFTERAKEVELAEAA